MVTAFTVSNTQPYTRDFSPAESGRLDCFRGYVGHHTLHDLFGFESQADGTLCGISGDDEDWLIHVERQMIHLVIGNVVQALSQAMGRGCGSAVILDSEYQLPLGMGVKEVFASSQRVRLGPFLRHEIWKGVLAGICNSKDPFLSEELVVIKRHDGRFEIRRVVASLSA